MGCGSVLAAEVMLADGSVVTASESGAPRAVLGHPRRGPGFWHRHALQAAHPPLPVIVKNTYFYTVDKAEAAVAEFVKLLPQSANRTEVLGAMGLFSRPAPPAGRKSGTGR